MLVLHGTTWYLAHPHVFITPLPKVREATWWNQLPYPTAKCLDEHWLSAGPVHWSGWSYDIIEENQGANKK